MAGGFTAAARVTPAFAALQRMMGPAAERATADPASRAAAVTLFIEATQPPEGLEPYVTSATAGVEIARRCLDTPAVRFRPPFVNSWRLSYPELAAALPRVCTGDTVIDTLRSLAVEFKIPNDFDSVCYGQGYRVAALVAEYRFQSTRDKEHKDGLDMLFQREDYKQLFLEVEGIQTQPLQTHRAAKQLLAHACLIGWAYLAGRDIPNRTEWQTLRSAAFGFPKSKHTVLQAVLNEALQFDRAGSPQPSWGMLIAPGVAKKLAADQWKLDGTPTSLDIWNSLVRSAVVRRHGAHAIAHLSSLDVKDSSTHLAFFLEPEAMELAADSLVAAFAVFGFAGKNTGSFSATFHGLFTRLKTLRRLPPSIPQKQTLPRLYLNAVEAAFPEAGGNVAAMKPSFGSTYYLNAVEAAFSEAGGNVASMLASPLAAMQRPTHFLDAAGDAAAAIRKLDADVAGLPPPTKPHTNAPMTYATPYQESPPPQGPPGVYYRWGHNACRHDVWDEPKGVRFGNVLVTIDRDKLCQN
ncbi:MAG: hypothetical protein SGPRY_001832 [Prymnesium sp.]